MMSEETATETTETTGTATETIPSSMIGEDGNFVKDWHKLLSDETLHEDKTLQTFKNVEGLAKSYVHVRKQVPLDKIAIPNENTTDAEWDNWHTAGGRPPTAVDYNIARPEDFPEEIWSDERANKWMERFHKAGLNPKQVAYLSGEHNIDILEGIKTQNDAIVANRQEIKDGLYKDWGAAYPQKEHQGNYAIEKGTTVSKQQENGQVALVVDEEFKARLCAKFGDDPDFIRFTSNLGGKFAEHGDIVESQVQTPGDIQAEIDKEMQTEAYKSGRHPGHKAAVAKVSRLFQEKSKVTPTGR